MIIIIKYTVHIIQPVSKSPVKQPCLAFTLHLYCFVSNSFNNYNATIIIIISRNSKAHAALITSTQQYLIVNLIFQLMINIYNHIYIDHIQIWSSTYYLMTISIDIITIPDSIAHTTTNDN